MRVGLPDSAGCLVRRLLLLAILVLALPASAAAQDPVTIEFTDEPSGVRARAAETLTFTSAGAASFTCALDGAEPTRCASPVTLPLLRNGPHVFTVRALGEDGAVLAQRAASWVVDSTTPVVTFAPGGPDGPSSTGPAKLAFSGGADTVELQCSLGGAPFTACTSPFDVEVRAGVTGELRVRAIDAVGNEGVPATRTWTGIAAPPPPAPTITSGPAGATRATTATFTYTAERAVSYECSLDGAPFGACGTLTGLAHGEHTFRVRGVDAAGTAGSPTVAKWFVDAIAPKVTLTEEPARVEGTEDVTFAFTVDDATATTTCVLDGRTVAPCAPGAAITDRVTGAGRHRLVVTAEDAVGNVGSDAVEWDVDLLRPVVTLGGLPANPTNKATAAFTVDSEDDATLDCRVLGPGHEADQFARCATVLPLRGLSSGTYTFQAQAIDAAGNAGEVVAHTWTVDLEQPVIAFTAQPAATTAAAAVDLAWTGSEPLARVSCLLDGAPTPCGPGSASVPNAALALAEHRFVVRAEDAAGNPATGAVTWTTSFEADFDWDPATAVIERPMTFTSRSAGDIRALAWDVDDDRELDDGTGGAAGWTFAEPGTYRVRLQATHRDGAVKVAERLVTVGRAPLITGDPSPAAAAPRPPIASFTVAPQPAAAGQAVTLTSTSTDPDGTLASWAWDLDGDGQFDDASGPTASRSFPAGTSLVGLRVVDADGLAATSFASVEVSAAAGTPKPPAGTAPKAPSMLAPFPVVRIAGTAVGSRIRLRIFAVKAPAGTRVEVRCNGRGCPFAVDRHRVAGKARTIRIRRLERSALRAGIVIEVRVHAPGRIGKYTRLVMRSGAAPKRTDACVSGARLLKTACPA